VASLFKHGDGEDRGAPVNHGHEEVQAATVREGIGTGMIRRPGGRSEIEDRLNAAKGRCRLPKSKGVMLLPSIKSRSR
jgi:hypothetical protein